MNHAPSRIFGEGAYALSRIFGEGALRPLLYFWSGGVRPLSYFWGGGVTPFLTKCVDETTSIFNAFTTIEFFLNIRILAKMTIHLSYLSTLPNPFSFTNIFVMENL